MQERCPAAVHIDGTARPQVIHKQDDATMYELLNAWHEKTGQPSLFNTSYNRHEEPIVCNLIESLSPLADNIVEAVFVNDKYIFTRG